MSVRIDHHVFQNATEANRVPDLRLTEFGKTNRLGVTTALDVEDALVRPAMFVVADEPPFQIGRERRFSSTGKAKEQGGVAVRPLVGRAVHRKYALAGESIIQIG